MDVEEIRCEACDCTLSKSEIVQTSNNSTLCQDCYDEQYIHCEGCNEDVPKEDAVQSELDDEYYCEACYDELFIRCGFCDNLIWTESAIYSEYSDCYLCENCFQEEHAANDDGLDCGNPRWNYYRARGEHKNSDTFKNLYIGVELELERINDFRWDELRDMLPSFFHIKSDGSLDDGVEIVNHPATYRYLIQHKELWEDIFKMGDDIEPQDTCGMHVHLSRNTFENNKHITRFESFFVENQCFCEAFSERNKHSLHEWASIDYLRDGDENSKSTAIYVHPYTVEIRLFASTNTASKFWSNIQFCKAIFELTKAENADISLSVFMNHIECNLHEYVELKSNALSYIKVIDTTV